MKVRETKGFVLQIQQGVLRDKSDMQVAEEMQSGWLQVPRMGYFAFPVTDVRGGTNQAEELMENAIKAARAQWTKGVARDVEMIAEVYEPLEGELRFNAWGGVEGPARCTHPSGDVYEGQFEASRRHGAGTFTYADGAVFKGDYRNGLMHGQGIYTWANGNVFEGAYQNGLRHGGGTFTWANGAVFEGDYRNGKMHGQGIYTLASGNVAVLIFEEDRPKGPGVCLEKAAGLFWLLEDGEKVQQISKEEARSSFIGRFVLLSGPRGGEEARPAGAPLVTALHVISALFSDCKGRRSHPNSSK